MGKLQKRLEALYHHDQPGGHDGDRREIPVFEKDANGADCESNVWELHQDPPNGDAVERRDIHAEEHAPHACSDDDAGDLEEDPEAKERNVDPGQPEDPRRYSE